MSSNIADRASHSEVDIYEQCERKHFYSYGLDVEPIQTPDTLARGIAVHEVLSSYYQLRREGYNHDLATEGALERVNGAVSSLRVYDEGALSEEVFWLCAWYFQRYEDDKFTVVETEVLHEVQITDDFILPIKVDLVVDTPDRGLIARDFKVTYDFYTVDKIDMSSQLPKYMAALHELGIKVQEVEYDQIRYRTSKDNKANPALRYMRVPVPITPEKVVRIMHEQFTAGRRIAKLKKMPLQDWEAVILRNSSACQFCWFKDICDADLKGTGDSNLIIQSFYQSRH